MKVSVPNPRTHESAKNELNAEMRLSSMTNAQTGSKIAKLQEKGTFYSKQLGVESKKLSDLDRQIAFLTATINDKRDKLRKVEGKNSESLTKDIKKLDRNLDKVQQTHNEILSENRQLKDEIDRLRRERVTFDKVYEKLESDLKDKKKVLGEAWESSEKAKEKKKKIENQIKTLKMRLQREESNIEKEFQDILKDINEKNVVDRIEEKFGNVDERKSPKKKENHNNLDNLNMYDDYPDADISRASMRKGFRSAEKRLRELSGKTPQEEVEEYNAVFESLKKKTNKTDLRDILALFEDYETKNYSLYQHLAHLSDEKETVEKQIQEVKIEIKGLVKAQENEGQEHDNKTQKIQELKHEIEDSETHSKFLETKQGGLTETINALKISIPIIFERIGCNIEDYANDLLDGSSVNEGNMLQYLGIIEKKTNEILQMYHFSQNKTEATNKIGGQGKINEEANVSVSTSFPPELLTELALLAAPEKIEKGDLLTNQDFEEDAKKRIKAQTDKKTTKPGKP